MLLNTFRSVKFPCRPLRILLALATRLGGMSAQRAHSVHNAHTTGRNWGLLLQLAIFLPILQTIPHPHNVGQPHNAIRTLFVLTAPKVRRRSHRRNHSVRQTMQIGYGPVQTLCTVSAQRASGPLYAASGHPPAENRDATGSHAPMEAWCNAALYGNLLGHSCKNAIRLKGAMGRGMHVAQKLKRTPGSH